MRCPICKREAIARVVKIAGTEGGKKVWFCHTECPHCGTAYDKWTEDRKES